MSELEMSAMPTPNPNTIKFIVNKQFFEKGSIDFPNPSIAEGSPLAEALFKVDGLDTVFVGKNFVSITKKDNIGWEDVLEPASDTLKASLSGDGPFISDALLEGLDDIDENDDEIVSKIKKILDDEIRPAIAMDGGDCQFISFEEGIVTLQLQGACSTCPSSVLTLKMGIEGRLKEEIPEVNEVVQL